MTWYCSWQEAEEANPDLDFDGIQDEETEAGKHDYTNYYGMIPHKDGTFRSIKYIVSYNNGVESVYIDAQVYEQYEEVVTRTGYHKI